MSFDSGEPLITEVLETLKLRALAFTSCGVTIADALRPEMPLIYVNQAFTSVTGYEENEVLGFNCRFLQRDDHQQPALREVRAALWEGRHARAVLRNYRKDGSPFWNELTLSPILDAQGRLTHFVGVQTDVTAREEAERERERLFGEIEKANRRLDDFAHIVSHDLRAPLRNIHQICDMFTDAYAPALDSEGQRLLGLLARRSRHLGAMIEGVLAHTRASRAKLHLEPVDLARLVAETVDLLGVPPDLRIEAAADLPVVQGDRIRLAQIFQNLIGNAVEHRDEAMSRVTIGWEDGGPSWHLWVEDDGPGVPERDQERIFQLFETLQGEERAGVGLSIVRGAVEALGGSVRLEPRVGRGTRFTLTLPKEPALNQTTG